MTTAPSYSHVHSALASAHFDIDDSVLSDTRDDGTWAVYLDSSLGRWEVFVDAVNGRVFVAPETWDGLDGSAQVAFKADFIAAYRGTGKRELRTLTDEVYQAAARRRAAAEGTAFPVATDRIHDLKARVSEAVVAAAGINSTDSLAQRQVFALRHAAIVEDLTALEAELARLRGAVEFSARALARADV